MVDPQREKKIKLLQVFLERIGGMAHFLFLVRVVITCLPLMSNHAIIQPKILSRLKPCDFDFQPSRVRMKEVFFSL